MKLLGQAKTYIFLEQGSPNYRILSGPQLGSVAYIQCALTPLVVYGRRDPNIKDRWGDLNVDCEVMGALM